MPDVLSLVNQVSSTSIPVEIASAVNRYTESKVTVGAIMQGPDADLDPDIQEMDLSIEYFNGNSNFDTQTYLKIHRHLRQNDYDIVHTHQNFSGSVSRVVSLLARTPVVNTEHNDFQYYSPLQKIPNLATFMIPAVNIYNSVSTKQSMDAVSSILSQRGSVIYNGVNIERIEESQNEELPIELPDDMIVSNVGVMTEQKNQRTILDTARKIKFDHHQEDIHFVIAGSGSLSEDLREKAEELEVNDMVTFTGYLPKREQVYSLLHKSDVFMMPSKYEGFCVAVVEAMACGLPIIASDIDVFNEVIGEDGILIPASDTQSISTKIIELKEQIDTRDVELIRQSLRERAKGKFTLKKTAQEYHSTYSEVVQE